MVYVRRTFQVLVFMVTAMALSVGAIVVENYTAQSGKLKVTFKPVKAKIGVGDLFVFEFKTISGCLSLSRFYLDENEQNPSGTAEGCQIQIHKYIRTGARP